MTNLVKDLNVDVIEKLISQIRGEIILPGNSNYDESRKVYNAMIDKHPGMIVKCVDVADVIYLLCLPEASRIIGQTVFVDDGYAVMG